MTFPPGPVDVDFQPHFSPDGLTLAFVRYFGRGNAKDIYAAPLSGGEVKRLTFDNVGVSGLDWTPDGRYIVFSSFRFGRPSLCKIPASGGNPEPLGMGQQDARFPSISRDGRRLVYTLRSVDYNIWRYDISKAATQNEPPTRLIASTASDVCPQVSSVGKRIVFASNRSGRIEMWVCDSDGSNPRQVTSLNGPGSAGTPRWSPDGRQIAFDFMPEGHGDIYVVNAEGGQPRRLTKVTSDEVVPSWSRDGRWIYFASDRTGAWQVWKAPAEGGQAVQVTRQGGFAAFESVDGKTLYYAKGQAAPGLWSVPVEGREEAPVLDQLAAGYWGYWDVVRDGIYFYNPGTKAFEHFSFATRQVIQVAKPSKDPPRFSSGLAVSPDGRWILFAQLDQDVADIMLVENFRW